MTTVARNHPCPCGSGKKYKLCCLGRQETARREAHQAALRDRIAARKAFGYQLITDDPLTNLSNRALDLIRAGKLDEAEQACRQLMQRYPEQIDGLQRTAMLLEARGDKAGAADHLRRALILAQSQDGFEPETFDWMQEQIARLEAAPPLSDAARPPSSS
jgi:hypothetical protein